MSRVASHGVAQCLRDALRDLGLRHRHPTMAIYALPFFGLPDVEGRLPRGINIERLRDAPTEWSRQFEALGLNSQQ
jgi:hypothetical protein